MQHPTPVDSATRISGTLKLQSATLGLQTALRSQASRTGVLLPEKWEVVEASWAAATQRMQGGCTPGIVGATPQSVLPHGRKSAETPVSLPADLVAQTT